jgi:DNA-binding HxlR family transcriptional regulator
MKKMEGAKMVSPIFIGRWTLKILFSLKKRPHRHGELRRHVGNVSQRMLTRTLRNLESTGLIARQVTRSRGGSCRIFLDPSWADNHRSAQRNVPLGQNNTAGK